jgi:hypothetical protein
MVQMKQKKYIQITLFPLSYAVQDKITDAMNTVKNKTAAVTAALTDNYKILADTHSENKFRLIYSHESFIVSARPLSIKDLKFFNITSFI